MSNGINKYANIPMLCAKWMICVENLELIALHLLSKKFKFNSKSHLLLFKLTVQDHWVDVVRNWQIQLNALKREQHNSTISMRKMGTHWTQFHLWNTHPTKYLDKWHNPMRMIASHAWKISASMVCDQCQQRQLRRWHLVAVAYGKAAKCIHPMLLCNGIQSKCLPSELSPTYC